MESENELAPAVSLQEYLLILRRRRAIIVQAFVLTSVVGLVVTLTTRPVYHASAKLLVEGPSYNLNTVDSSNPLSSLFQIGQQQTVDTQVEVLQAQPMMEKVARQVGPATLSVTSVKDTNVIEVAADANDPRTAAAAPNTLLKLFLAEDADQNLGEITSAKEFVTREGAKARKNLDAADRALKAFKQKNHVVELAKNRDDQIARVTALTDLARKTRTDLAALRAQIAADRGLLAQQPATIGVTLRATNALRADLQADIDKLQVQRQGLTQKGGFRAASPQIVALDAQVTELTRQLALQPALAASRTSSPNAVREALRGQIVTLEAQGAALQTQVAATGRDLAQATAQVGHYADWEVTLARLTREHDDAAAADKMFTDKMADLSLREKARHATARVIEAAQVPASPVRPRKAQSILLACFFGLFVGISLALLQEHLDDRINTAEDADRVLGLPSLGRVPTLTAEDARLLPLMPGLDPAAESYRVLRTNIHFASVDTPARTLVVTSSGPGEGKTTTAANLAFAMVMDGKKVILVDTDLRRPSLHRLLQVPTVPGLTDVLLGDATLEDTLLEHTEMPNLMTLTAGSTPPNPADLLGSRTFRTLVGQLRDQADLVIFDSPPMLAAADSQILASQMDGVVLVVEMGETKKAAARHALTLLRQARANVLGVAQNKMKVLDGNGYYYQYSYGTPALSAGANDHGRSRLTADAELTRPEGDRE